MARYLQSTLSESEDDSCEPSTLEQNNQFYEDIKKARAQCEKAGVGWPGWYWSAGVELVGEFVLYDGDLCKVTAKTVGGFYGDAIYYDPKSKRADENGFVHCMGMAIPRAYDPFKKYYRKCNQKPQDSQRGTQYVQMSIFDFLGESV